MEKELRNDLLEKDEREPEPPCSPRPEVAKASVTAMSLNMINNIVGAGLFSMPWVLYESTIVTGFVMLAFMAILNSASFLIIAKCCDLSGTFNYKEMGKQALGKHFGTVIQCCCLLYTAGSCISYVVLTGDFLVGAAGGKGTGVFDKWAQDTILSSRPFVMGVIAVTVFLPLCMLKNLEKLKYTSFISFIATIYAGFLVVYVSTIPQSELQARGVITPHDIDVGFNETTFFGFPSGVFLALPIVNVAFTAHYNAPRFYQELEHRSIKKFSLVVAISLAFSLIIYGMVAVCGYRTFGQATLGDVLKNFNESYELAIIARLALAFVVICTFPLANHSLRESFITLWFKGRYNTESAPSSVFLAVTIGSIIIMTSVGVSGLNIEDVLAYKGAIFGSCIVYIFPAFMYMKLKQNVENRVSEHSETGDYRDSWGALCNFENAPLIFMVVWGVATGTLSVILTVKKQAGL